MLSSNIAKLRKNNGLTQIEFAKKLHVTQSAVSHWESGRTMPDTTQLFNIAQLFGLTVDELSNSPTNLPKDPTPAPVPAKEMTPADRRAEGRKLLEEMSDEEYDRAIAVLKLLNGGKG